MIEPTYEDVDDDGMAVGRQAQTPAWRTSKGPWQELLTRAFTVCGRQKFIDAKEHRTWIMVGKKLTKGVMSEAWVENCILWAGEKNKERLAIKFSALLSTIMNIDRQKEWEAKNRIADESADVVIDEGEDDVVIG